MQQNDLQKMSIPEKLQMMEFLWESLVESKTAIQSPSWHGDLVSSRLEAIKSGKSQFIPINELKNIT